MDVCSKNNKLPVYLIFTDIDRSQLQDQTFDDRVGINYVQEDDYDLSGLERSILETKRNAINVERILFFLPRHEEQNTFTKCFQKLLKTTLKQFEKADVYLWLPKESNRKLQPSCRFIINVAENVFDNFADFNIWIDMHFVKKQFRYKFMKFRKYNCYHCEIKEYLEKRCKSMKLDGEKKWDNYKIIIPTTNEDLNISLIRNSDDEIYSVQQITRPEVLLLKLNNAHLLGLYNPILIFEVVDIICKISAKIHQQVQIHENEIKLVVDCLLKNVDQSQKNSFEEIISNFDHFFQNNNNRKKRFKIQLLSNNYFVLNRRLKVSLPVLSHLVGCDATELLVDLAISYFNCFSIAPVCCRMQSLSPVATVYDFEKFTYSHIDINRSLYIKMCKLLFPFVVDVNDEILQKEFFEVIPVALIGRMPLLSFNRNLEELQQFIINVLPNGNIEIASFLTLSPDMLDSIDVEKLKVFIQCIKENKNIELNPEILKLAKFDYASKNYFSMNNMEVYFRNIEHIYSAKNLCLLEQDLKNEDALIFLFYEQTHVLAFTMNEATLKKLQELESIFNQTFSKNVTSLVLFNPKCKSNEIQHFTSMDDPTYIYTSNSPKKNLFKNYYIDDRYVFHSYIKQSSIEDIVKELKSFEDEEGIVLIFVKNTIDTIENLNMLIAELDADTYKATADFAFYNEGDLNKSLEKIKCHCENMNISIEITIYGLIKFYDCIEISPTLLLRIKDIVKLINVIKSLANLMTKKNTEMVRVSKGDKDSQNIAILLNPYLKSLEDDVFQMLNCIPAEIDSSEKKNEVFHVLENMRKTHTQIRLFPNARNIFFDLCSFSTKNMPCCDNVAGMLSEVQRNLQNINIHNHGIIVINDSSLQILPYENYEKQIFKHPKITKVDKQTVKKCYALCKEFMPSPAAFIQNGTFLINESLLVDVDYLHKILSKDENVQPFINATKNYKELSNHLTLVFPDNWISLSIENKELTDWQKKFSSFTITDDNQNVYLQLAKTISSNLEEIPVDLSTMIITREMLMDTENTKNLVKIIQNLKKKNQEPVLTTEGSISVGDITLTVSQFLKIKSVDNFIDFLKELEEVVQCDIDKIREAGDDLTFPLHVISSGLFFHAEKHFIPKSPKKYCDVVKDFFDFMEKDKKEFPMTLDSKENIMIGNFIWMNKNDFEPISGEILKMIELHERAIIQGEANQMKSIFKLAQKSVEDKQISMEMAKIINKNLVDFSDELVCNEMLRIIPTDLWEKCNNDRQTYKKVIELFQQLEDKGITWNIKLNGNISLDEKIVVTITDLLGFFETGIEKKCNELMLLLKTIEDTSTKLLCEEEIIHGQRNEKRVYETKLPSYGTITEAKEKLKKIEVESRIEPNGSLLVNKNLWVQPEGASKNTEYVIEISKKTKNLFPNSRFQFGNPVIPILTSILTTSDENLFQYCVNVRQLLKEKYPEIEISYVPNSNLFRLNNLLDIHPRPFLHLKMMENVIDLLKDYTNNFKEDSSFLQPKNKMSANEIKFFKKLWEIKGAERVEFHIVRHECFKHIAKILWEEFKSDKNKFETIGNICNVINDNEDEYYGITKIKIKDKFIFKDGITNEFMEIKKDKLSFKKQYHEKLFEALEYANNVEDYVKCKNLFDFQSVIEILLAFPKFIEKYEKTDISKFTKDERHAIIQQWLKKIKEEQNKTWKYKFSNSLKGLHHWFKHYKGFASIRDMYAEMNEFFENTPSNGIETDTQNGEFIGRRYDTKDYFGSYMIAHSDNKAGQNCVATFYKKSKPMIFNTIDDNSLSKYLLFTDNDLKKFESTNNVHLHKNISVRQLNASNFIALKDKLKNMNFSDVENVDKIVFFIPELVKKQTEKNLKKTVQSLSKEFTDFIAAVQAKFHSKAIILCYPILDPVNANQDLANALLNPMQSDISIKKIPEYLLKFKIADDIIEFLIDCFTP